MLGGIEDAARLEDFLEVLAGAADRDLPMVCANPDIVAVQANSAFGTAPGAAGMMLDTALIMAGIHGPGFDLVGGLESNLIALEQLEAEFGVRPRRILPRFRWAP